MSVSDSRLKRTRVSTSRWRNASFGVTRQIEVWTRWLRPGQQPQALRGLVEQIGLRQDAPADRHHGVGGKDVGAGQLVVELHRGERGFRLGAGEPVGAGPRQLALLGHLVDVGRPQRVGLDADLVDQREPARRAGGKDEFGAADDHFGALRACEGPHADSVKNAASTMAGSANVTHSRRAASRTAP